MNVTVYKQDGSKKGTTALPKEIFEVEASVTLIHEAEIRHLANKRQNVAKTKTKTDVRGGGRKPWRQKGTGRARQGSIRSAQWRGGGIIFGPTGNENYSKQMPKKMRRKALCGALSSKAKGGDILVLDKFVLTEPKTKTISNLLNKIGIERNVLIVLPQKDLIAEKSISNLENAITLLAPFLNVHDILKYDKILFLEEAIDVAKNTFAPTKS